MISNLGPRARIRRLLVRSRWRHWIFPFFCCLPYLFSLIWLWSLGQLWIVQIMFAPLFMFCALAGLTLFLAFFEVRTRL